jgi:hypothetical protein
VTSNQALFERTAQQLEQMCVAFLNGVGPLVSSEVLAAAAQLVSVEARQVAWITRILGGVPADTAFDPAITLGQARTAVRATGFLETPPARTALRPLDRREQLTCTRTSPWTPSTATGRWPRRPAAWATPAPASWPRPPWRAAGWSAAAPRSACSRPPRARRRARWRPPTWRSRTSR